LVAVSTVSIALGLVGYTVGQQPTSDQNSSGQQTTGGNRTPAATPGTGHDLSHYMTKCLIVGNEGEIALAKIAKQRATDPELKQFAQKMIEDHTAFVNKLRPRRPETVRSQRGRAVKPKGPASMSMCPRPACTCKPVNRDRQTDQLEAQTVLWPAGLTNSSRSRRKSLSSACNRKPASSTKKREHNLTGATFMAKSPHT
jgi:hypothetical protein